MGSLAKRARRFSYLVRLEAREARATYGFVLALGLLLAVGRAWWLSRSGSDVTLGWSEARGHAWLAQLLLIPILADVFSANDERAAQRVVASLPVSSTAVFLARWTMVAGAALTLFLGLVLARGTFAALGPTGAEPALSPAGIEGSWGSIYAWMLGGSPAFPLVVYSATCLVALVFRHGLSATLVGVFTIVSVVALLASDLVNRGERLLGDSDVVVNVLFSSFTPLVLLLTLSMAFRLRGSASRSWVARCVRVGAAVVMCSGMAAGAVEFKEWQRRHYGFDDPDASVSGWPGVTLDGSLAVLSLEREGWRTGWALNLTNGEVERASEAHLSLFTGDPTLTFHRGLERRSTAVVRGSELVNEDWLRRVVEERWTSEFGAPPMIVTSLFVISPRRREPHVAYYLDAERWFHRVDLADGTDVKMDIQIDGEPMSAGVDEDGRWLTWNGGRREDGVLRGVNLVTGERFEHVPESREKRIYGGYIMASFGGGPVLTAFTKDGPSHFMVRGGKVVPLPLVRRYSKLTDVDGERLLGCTDDGGVYLIGHDGEETVVFRAEDAVDPPQG